MRRSSWGLPAVLLVAAGCSSVQVRAVGSAEGPAYELHGATLAQLQAEIDALCPRGHRVLRQARHERRSAVGDVPLGPVLQRVGDALSGADGERAQALVQCTP